MAEGKDRRVIILSIYPKYVHAILQGRKLVEFRKNGVPTDIDYILFYSTSPDQAILGYASVKECVIASPAQLWEEFGDMGQIDHEAYKQYFLGYQMGKCYLLGTPCALQNSISISEIGMPMPPQSFAYIKHSVWSRIRKRKLTNRWQLCAI